MLETYAKILRLQVEVKSRIAAPGPVMDRESISGRLRQGTPLVSLEDLSLDWPLVQELFRSVASVLADYASRDPGDQAGFPGYTPDTGGLLAEADLAVRRAAFVRDEASAFWRRLGLDATQTDELRVSLFAYENPALPALLDTWVADGRPITCLVPEGRIVPQLAAWLSVFELQPGEVYQRGALRLQILSFLDQDAYDHLLWACDLNFVRGEDSCVRAQWAARPLVWQAYPQADAAHWDKLNALLAHYTEGLDRAAARAVSGLWRHWNGILDADGLAACWAAWRAHQAVIERHAGVWCDRLGRAGSLTDKLVDFAKNKLK